MNADTAQLLAQLCHQCGIHLQLVIPYVNGTSVTTQVSLPAKPSQVSAQRPTPSSSTAMVPEGSHMTNTGCASDDLAIKVINSKCKWEAKTYILHSISVSHVTTLKCLKEIILEQLGKTVVSFRLGLMLDMLLAKTKSASARVMTLSLS